MNVANAPAPKCTQWANSNRLIEIIDVSLRSCAQVMFQNNPLTGVLLFAAIFVGAYSEGIPAVAWGCAHRHGAASRARQFQQWHVCL